MTPFREYFAQALRQAHLAPRVLPRGECQGGHNRRCMLCHASGLDYADEVKVKDGALQSFIRDTVPSMHLDRLVPSPRGRGYRTVTKRKVFLSHGHPALALIDPSDVSDTLFHPGHCAIEPPQHAAIYRTVQNELRAAPTRPLAETLSYVVIKGTYDAPAVIFNVRQISGPVIRAAGIISRSLSRGNQNVTGVFLYEDPAAGGYYLGSSNARKTPRFRKVYGDDHISLHILGRHFTYSPDTFAQVNLSILDAFISSAAGLLAGAPFATLYDLYCGFGLLSLCLTGLAGGVVGADISMRSIESARINARRQRVGNARFLRHDIDGDSIPRILRDAGPGDGVILDPPFGGTAPGVLEYVGSRNVARVLHIFCNIDLIASELSRWKQAGYGVERAVALDMFPGTSSVEVLVILRR